MYYTWKKTLIRNLIQLLYPEPQQILYFNFKQPALPHIAKKKKNPTARLKIPQLCVFQFPALLASPTFSVACQLTDYNKHVVLVSLRKDNIFSLLIFKKHFFFLKLKLTFDSKQLLCLISWRRKSTWRYPSVSIPNYRFRVVQGHKELPENEHMGSREGKEWFFSSVSTFVWANGAQQSTVENKWLLNICTLVVSTENNSSTSAQVSNLLPCSERKERVKDLGFFY